MSNTLKWYVVPRENGLGTALINSTIWTFCKLTSITLASYTAYQVAAHDVAWNPEFINAVTQKISWWVQQTVHDVRDAVQVLIVHHSAIKNILLENVWWELASREDANTVARLIAQAWWKSQVSLAHAQNNIITRPVPTSLSSISVWLSMYLIWKNLIDLVLLRDKMTFWHRVRANICNTLRRKNRSRKVDIPDRDWNTFERV